MDEVAAKLLEWDLMFGFRAERKARPAFLLEYGDDIIAAAQGFRRRRFGDERVPGLAVDASAKQWRWGRGAARSAFRFFEYAVGQENKASSEMQRKCSALRHLVRISFQIQKCDPNEDSIYNVIKQVGDLCVRGIGRPSRSNEINLLLLQSIDDIEEWVAHITDLATEFQ
jgi:hypothetical protein